MLSIKKTLTKLLQDVHGIFRGADPSQIIDYANAYQVTPSRDGWLVVKADTDTGVTIAPIIRLSANSMVVAEQTGITYQGSSAFLTCYVKKGVTYTVDTYRCSRKAVYLA